MHDVNVAEKEDWDDEGGGGVVVEQLEWVESNDPTVSLEMRMQD